MKKSVILIALIIFTSSLVAQSRGGRGGNARTNDVIYVQANNAPLSNVSANVYSNLDNNVGNMNYSNVQMSNVNFNNNKIQQQAVNPTTRNVNINVSRNVSTNDFAQNRSNNRGNVADVNVEPQVVEQEQFIQEPIQQMVIDNVDNEVALNVNPVLNMNVTEINTNIDLSFSLDNSTQQQQKQKDEEPSQSIENDGVVISFEKPQSLEMPKLNLNFSKKSSVSSARNYKKYKRHSYSQHVSIMEKIAAKTASIKHVLKKKKHKKVVCSVVCYHF